MLFCAIKLHSAILTLLAMLVQLGALAFYCASFIPFAQVRRHISMIIVLLERHCWQIDVMEIFAEQQSNSVWLYARSK